MDGLIYATQEEADAAEQKQLEDAEKQRKEELVRTARKHFTMAEEAERELRIKADEDLRFRAGEQWDPIVLRNRTIDRRPALVINRIPQFERQITNEQRQARPAINVSPIDSSADPDTAEVFQGLIRHIEYDSGADVAYDTALTSAVRSGLGYVRAVTEYEHEESFEQCLKIKRVRDPFSVYLDPCSQEQDGSDINWAFVVDDGISEDEFKREYPDAEPVKGGWGDRSNNTSKTCQVVEYFYRERVEDELLTLQPMAIVMDPATGQPIHVPAGEPVTALKSVVPQEVLSSSEVLSRRPTFRMCVRWAKIAGSKVVSETEFPSKWIPIVPVLGDELWVGGKRILEGIVRNAKDPQRMYNYWSTAITETIALAPKAPWIGYEGQFAGHEKQWADASVRNVPYLEVNAKPINGQLAPLPTRNQFDAPIGAMTQAMQFASEDMKATTGIYDAALGNRSNEQTGVAIRARQGQSVTSTLHFADNLARALRHLGRILVDAIPRVYSGARIVRILGEDQTDKMVAINGAPPVKGQDKIYDLNTGRYDVAVSMGPSFTSKRQETVQAAMELSRSSPQIASVIADIMIRNMDWPGAKEMADRLQKLLPPEIRPPDEGKTPPTQVLMQQVQQQGAMIQKMGSELHRLSNILETEEIAHKAKERIELIKAQVELVKTAAELKSKETQNMLDRTQEYVLARMSIDDQPDDIGEPAIAAQPQGVPNGSSRPPALRAAPTPGPAGAGPGNPAGSPWGPATGSPWGT